MTIEEMKAKGFKRYSAFIKKLIYTEEIEVWARNIEDAYKIFECSADEIFDSCFADREYTEILGLGECEGDIPIKADGQGAFARCNEDFYKSEEKRLQQRRFLLLRSFFRHFYDKENHVRSL